MHMKVLGMVLFAVVLLAGCVSTRNASVSDERSRDWRGKGVVWRARPRADFVASTAGKAAFALLGVAAMISAGNEIMQKNGIEDPVPILGEDLLAAAQEHYGVIAATPARVSIDTTDIGRMAHAAKGADLLLDVHSLGSQFRYFPTDWSHYAVDSTFKVLLIDVPKGSLIAEGFCRQTTQKDPSPPTKDELLADGAARLKAILTSQREACLEQLKKDVLAIS
jgi:hypothetical protein